MNDREWIVDRIGAAAFEQLSTGLAGSDLHSVLLEVMHHRARRRTPADVLTQYLRDGFCAPADIDLRTSLRVDGHLLAAAEAFEALDLSPVAPLGVSSAIAHTGQNRVLSALRMTEVVSDPTNVLALEFAAARKPLDHAYYSGGLRYQIWVTAPDGSELPLVDGGVFDWLTRLAANRRAVYVASGTGAQLIAWRFRKAGEG